MSQHKGRKQPWCDISTGWVTDVQLYKVAFMTRGEDLCEIWESHASVPLYIENMVDNIGGVGEVQKGKACLSAQYQLHLKMKIAFLRGSLVSVGVKGERNPP